MNPKKLFIMWLNCCLIISIVGFLNLALIVFSKSKDNANLEYEYTEEHYYDKDPRISKDSKENITDTDNADTEHKNPYNIYYEKAYVYESSNIDNASRKGKKLKETTGNGISITDSEKEYTFNNSYSSESSETHETYSSNVLKILIVIILIFLGLRFTVFIYSRKC